MGSTPAELPGQPELPAGPSSLDPIYVPAVPRRERLWPYLALFLATCYTTTAVGAQHYLSFYRGFGDSPNPFSEVELLTYGLWYSVPILAILGCHELGHYYACRFYGVASSRPYFLPMPFLLTGTLGA